jgi:hypothetical protein
MLERIKPIDGLVDEILDNLPESIWTSDSTTFLDPAVGGGQFVKRIESKLKSYGHSKNNIKNRVFGFEYNQALVDLAVNMSKLVGQYTKKTYSDFLEKDTNMKFDVIVGNPPYQKTLEHGKKVNDNLWAPFVFRSWDLLKDDGYLCYVTPDGRRTPTNDFRTERKGVFKDIISPYRTVAVNLNECERHFSVGSTISYYVVQKTLDKTNKTKVISTHGIDEMELGSMPLIPRDLSKHGLSIFKKVMADKSTRWNFTQKQTKLNKSLQVSETKDNGHPFQLFDSHGSADIKFCDKKGEDHSSPKAMLSYVGRYKVMVDEGNITPAQHTHRQVLKLTELLGAVSQLSSKLYRFIIEGNRSNQYIEKHIPNMMPKLDLNRTWTDADIYAHFGLTQEEINYVETSNVT